MAHILRYFSLAGGHIMYPDSKDPYFELLLLVSLTADAHPVLTDSQTQQKEL